MSLELKKHVLFTEYRKVIQWCNSLQNLNIIGFTFVRRFADGSFVDLSNQLEWSEYFLERYFNQIYPINCIQDHMFSYKGISLWDLNPDNLIWQEGKQLFDFGHGISIVKKNSHYDDLYCFYTKKNNEFMNTFYLNSINLLKKFCDYFTEEANLVIQKGKKNRLQTPFKYQPLTTESDRQQSVSFSYDDEQKFLNSLSKHSNIFDGLSSRLTQREEESIQLIAQGFTIGTAAKKLFISSRTVETHLNNAKKKLHCSTLPQLVFMYYQFQNHFSKKEVS